MNKCIVKKYLRELKDLVIFWERWNKFEMNAMGKIEIKLKFRHIITDEKCSNSGEK